MRLPRLIGLKASLGMLLTGRSVGATEARQLGLVDIILHNSSSRDRNGQLMYPWMVELSQHWRAGKLGGEGICTQTSVEEKPSKATPKAGGKSASGKGTARARMMRPNQPSAGDVPQRQIAYKINHRQGRFVNMKDVILMNDSSMLGSALLAAQKKISQKYVRRWSCWTHVEQTIVYRVALSRIDKEYHGMFPAPYLCLWATMKAWQIPFIPDACSATIDLYTALALSPEAVSLMATFLDMRRSSKRALQFGLPSPVAAPDTAQQESRLSTASVSSNASDMSDASAGTDDSGSKRKKRKKKKSSLGDKLQSDVSPAPSPLSTRRDSPAQLSVLDVPVPSESSSCTDIVKESVERAVTLVGDASPQSMSLLLQLLVAEIPVYFLAPSDVIAHAMLSRVRLQMNHQLKNRSLTPALKIARLSHLRGGGTVEHWQGWMEACCKDLHKIFWDQRPGSVTPVAHVVLVASTVDSDTYTVEELVKLCNSVTVVSVCCAVLICTVYCCSTLCLYCCLFRGHLGLEKETCSCLDEHGVQFCDTHAMGIIMWQI